MRLLVFLLTFLGAADSAVAQGGVRGAVAPRGSTVVDAEGHGTIRGKVVTPDGKPVYGAQVRLLAVSDTSPGQPRTREKLSFESESRTDRLGHFEFAQVPLGQWRIFVASEIHGFRRTEAWTQVLQDGAEVRCDITVGEGRAIRGRVLAADGGPLSGVTVRLLAAVRGATAISAEDGSFALTGLDDGEQMIRAVGRGCHLSTGWVKVASGTNDVVLRMPGGGAIEGRVLDHTGQPELVARVKLFPHARPGEAPDSAPADGSVHETRVRNASFRFDFLVPGRYSLVATTPNCRIAVVETVVVTAGQVRRGLDVQLVAGASLQVSVGGEESGALLSLLRFVGGWDRCIVRRNDVIVGDLRIRSNQARIAVPPGRLEITLISRFRRSKNTPTALEQEITVSPGEVSRVHFDLPPRPANAGRW